jgi:hypothetical protein
MGGQYWSSTENAIAYYSLSALSKQDEDEENDIEIGFTFDYWTDIAIIAATGIQLISTFLYWLLYDHFIWIEIARLLQVGWKLAYVLLT